jgi:carboxyl-terminal processing protease
MCREFLNVTNISISSSDLVLSRKPDFVSLLPDFFYMNNAIRLLIPVFALLCFRSYATDDARTIRQASQLVARLKKEHVKPPVIDEQFGRLVNANVIRFLDPENNVFTTGDIAEFERLSANIPNDLDQQQLTYYSVVSKRFQSRMAALKTLTGTVLAASVPLKSTMRKNASDFDRRPSEKEHTEKWKQTLQLEVIGQMIVHLGSNRQFPADSLSVLEAQARKEVQRQYDRMFKELTEEETDLASIYLMAIALAFDPHTLYFSPSGKKDFEEELTSDRELYGFSYGTNASGDVIITNILPGSPAWLSNELHEGDIVQRLKIAEHDLDLSGSQYSLTEISRVFEEANDRNVEMTVLDKTGKQQVVRLTKEKVYSDADIVKNAVLKGEKTIGYITLPDFYMNLTDTSSLGCANDVAKCILKLKKENIDGLILDLRGNGGGSLREAVDLTGLFIDYGPIVAMRDKKGDVLVMKDFNRGSVYNGPLIVLIDEGSASSSEIVAGALQDYNKALIVGRTSFGKATSQRIYPLDPNYTEFSAAFMQEDPEAGYANITTALLYRVTRAWNQKNGVTPDLVLPFASDAGELELERTYVNALVPDSITKKMPFTPGAQLPVDALKRASAERLATQEQFIRYTALLQAIEILRQKDSIVSPDLQTRLDLHNQWLDLAEQIEAFEETLNAGFTPQSNAFDNVVYESNPVLRQYNERFLEALKADIELIEAVHIMNDLIGKEH